MRSLFFLIVGLQALFVVGGPLLLIMDQRLIAGPETTQAELYPHILLHKPLLSPTGKQ